MIYSATAAGPYKFPGVFDPDAVRIIGVIYRPDAWAANTVYYLRSAEDYDIVIPTSFGGYYYKIASPGKSGAVEPIWPTEVGAQVTDGTIVWEAVAYNLLPPTDTISSSQWLPDVGVSVSGPLVSGGKTKVTVQMTDKTLTSFSVTNRVTISSGVVSDTTIQFRVAER